LTFLPERPDLSFPRFISCIARLTFCDDLLPYFFLDEDLGGITKFLSAWFQAKRHEVAPHDAMQPFAPAVSSNEKAANDVPRCCAVIRSASDAYKPLERTASLEVL
jgi:hypothetical protein